MRRYLTLVLLVGRAFAALPATTVWEARTTGSDTSGGGFDSASGGTDYSQQNSAQVVIDNATITATCNGTVITFTGGTYTVLAGDKGNVVQMISGTGLTVGFYNISSVSAGLNGTWTLDRSTGMSGGSITSAKMGGALAGPQLAVGASTSNNIIWVKSGTYSITNTSNNASGGIMVIATTTGRQLIGYGASRGDFGTPPVLQASGISSATLVSNTANSTEIINVTVDGASLTSIRGISSSTLSILYLVTAKNCTNNGIVGSNSGCLILRCVATGCTTQTAILFGQAWGCVAFNNSGVSGFGQTSSTGSFAAFSLAYGNSIGFNANAGTSNFLNCTAYGNSSHGFNLNASNTAQNCVSEGNGGWGFNVGGTTVLLFQSATFNNTSGGITGSPVLNIGPIAYLASAFVNSAGSNFSLNNNNPGGAQLRAAGFPGTLPDGANTGYLDIGALQHQDTGGGGVSGIYNLFVNDKKPSTEMRKLLMQARLDDFLDRLAGQKGSGLPDGWVWSVGVGLVAAGFFLGKRV